MTIQLRAAALALFVALAFVALQLAVDIQTGLAGIFVMGMAGGLFVGDLMARQSSSHS